MLPSQSHPVPPFTGTRTLLPTSRPPVSNKEASLEQVPAGLQREKSQEARRQDVLGCITTLHQQRGYARTEQHARAQAAREAAQAAKEAAPNKIAAPQVAEQGEGGQGQGEVDNEKEQVAPVAAAPPADAGTFLAAFREKIIAGWEPREHEIKQEAELLANFNVVPDHQKIRAKFECRPEVHALLVTVLERENPHHYFGTPRIIPEPASRAAGPGSKGGGSGGCKGEKYEYKLNPDSDEDSNNQEDEPSIRTRGRSSKKGNGKRDRSSSRGRKSTPNKRSVL